MNKLKCGVCGISGIHACLGKPVVTNDLMLIQTLGNRIAELEKERDELRIQVEVLKHSDAEYYGLYSELLFSPNEPPVNLEAHNLEQQAKGLREYSEHLISDAEGIPEGLEHKGRGSNIYNWQTHFARELRYRANNLSNAKETLKEQDNGE